LDFITHRGYAEIAKLLTKVLGIKWTLRGREYLSKNEACVIVANHQTCLDVLGMFSKSILLT